MIWAARIGELRYGFVDAVSICWTKYVVVSGRARRSEYWWWILFTILFGLFALYIDNALGFDGDVQPLQSLVALALLLPTICVTVRRLHDTDGRAGGFCSTLFP